MSRAALFALFCLAASSADAARIKDMSLSPEESFQQPNIIRAPAPLGGQPISNEAPPPGTVNLPGMSSARFMDGYCDPSVNPRSANAMQECMQQARADACQRFQRLPADAQAALDRVIACDYAAGEDGAPAADCVESVQRQLQLIKKYWNDPDTSHALVFLPDKVNNPAADCKGR